MTSISGPIYSRSVWDFSEKIRLPQDIYQRLSKIYLSQEKPLDGITTVRAYDSAIRDMFSGEQFVQTMYKQSLYWADGFKTHEQEDISVFCDSIGMSDEQEIVWRDYLAFRSEHDGTF